MPRVSEEIGDRDGCVKSRGWVAVSNKQTRVFAEWEVDVMKKPRRNLISDRFYWILGGETRRSGGRCGWRGSFFLAFRTSEEISLKRDLLKFRETEADSIIRFSQRSQKQKMKPFFWLCDTSSKIKESELQQLNAFRFACNLNSAIHACVHSVLQAKTPKSRIRIETLYANRCGFYGLINKCWKKGLIWSHLEQAKTNKKK